MNTSDKIIIMNYDDTPEILDQISECKKRFINNNEDPRKFPYICSEVADSWIRSREFGILPDTPKQQTIPNTKEIQSLLKANKLLLQAAIPFIKKFKPLLSISNYMMLLTDKSGVVLFLTGDQSIVNSVNNENYGVGSSSCCEEMTGTTAASLSITHKKPVQLVGPNNYLIERDNDIASSAPILNSANEVIGTLGIIQSSGARNQPQNIRAHSLGWVTSMAQAISNQLELMSKNKQLETAYRTLDATFSVVDEGIITINNQGMVTHINNEAFAMLGIVQNDNDLHHYSKYLGYEPTIEKVFQSGSAVHDIEISIGNDSLEPKCLISIEPILNDEKTQFHGAVIRMTRSSRIDKLISRRGGSNASYVFSDIKGESDTLHRSLKIATQISKTNANVLLIGESGTGKELFAQAIHNNYCPDGPFVAINCASMPRTLIESELFGYEGGTFTGAEKKGRPGKFELANGGTLFLDEIGDMPLEIQPILLRVLEERKVIRLGGSKYIPVDVRIIAATNKNLLEVIKSNQFRKDLYYRLAVFKIDIPPLRNRNKDALVLAEYFIKETCAKMKIRTLSLSEDTRQTIINYSWPGNARQLENAIVYAVHMCEDQTITPKDLPDEITAGEDSLVFKKSLTSLTELERDAIEEAMRYTDNDTAQAAKILGIGRTTLYRKLKEYDLKY